MEFASLYAPPQPEPTDDRRRRCKDRWLQIGTEIIPQPIGCVEVALLGVAQEVLEPVRFGRIEKAENTALILAESAARYRPEQTRHHWMQRPTILQHDG